MIGCVEILAWERNECGKFGKIDEGFLQIIIYIYERRGYMAVFAFAQTLDLLDVNGLLIIHDFLLNYLTVYILKTLFD